MYKICLAIGNKQLEDYLKSFDSLLSDKIGKEVKFVGEAVYREAVLELAKSTSADLIIINENLKGNIDILDLVYNLRISSPQTRIIFISKPRDVGHVFFATLIQYSVYDIIVGEEIDVMDIFRRIVVANTIKSVQHFLPKVKVDENTNKQIFSAPEIDPSNFRDDEEPISIRPLNTNKLLEEKYKKSSLSENLVDSFEVEDDRYNEDDFIIDDEYEIPDLEIPKYDNYNYKEDYYDSFSYEGCDFDIEEPDTKTNNLDNNDNYNNYSNNQNYNQRKYDNDNYNNTKETENVNYNINNSNYNNSVLNNKINNNITNSSIKFNDNINNTTNNKTNKIVNKNIKKEIQEEEYNGKNSFFNNIKGGIKKEKKGLFARKQTANIVKQQVVSFVGTGGGSGTSTLAFNTALSLAQDGYNVVYVDLNQDFSSIDSLFQLAYKDVGIDTAIKGLKEDDYELVERSFSNIEKILKIVRKEHNLYETYTKMSRNIDFLFFSQNYMDLVEKDDTYKYLKELIAYLKTQDYHFIILDLHGNIKHKINEFSLRSSTKLFITLTQDYASISNNLDQLDIMDKNRINYTSKMYYLINKYENINNLSTKRIEEMILATANNIENTSFTQISNYHKDILNSNFMGTPFIWKNKHFANEISNIKNIILS